jgi:hypothetical protein
VIFVRSKRRRISAPGSLKRMADIFEFWSRIKRGERIHPADKEVFHRIDAGRHGFQLDCLPGCFAGQLKTAPIVLLYLSPGHSEATTNDAKTKTGKNHHFRTYWGDEPLRDAGPGRKWVESRTKNFGSYESIKHKLAFLNIGAYHSKDVKDYASLLALPSSRVSLAWAQETLFPQAEAGERIVICMRSAAYWGLETGRKYKGTLFAPSVNRGGHLVNGLEKNKIIELVRRRLAQ